MSHDFGYRHTSLELHRMPDSHHPLYKLLGPVCGRMKLQAALSFAVRGLAAGAAIAFVLGLCRVSVSASWPTTAALAVLVLSPLAGMAVGMLTRRDWRAAARAIDDRYRLDDRTLTALTAVQGDASRPMAQLLLRDALGRLRNLRAREVVPLRLPRGVMGALVLSAFAVLVALVPLQMANRLSTRSSETQAARAAAQPAAKSFQPVSVSPAALETGRAAVARPHASSDGDNDPERLELYDRRTVENYFAPP